MQAVKARQPCCPWLRQLEWFAPQRDGFAASYVYAACICFGAMMQM